MESQPQCPQFRNNPENFHLWRTKCSSKTSKLRSLIDLA